MNEAIQRDANKTSEQTEKVTCSRCNGTGYLSQYAHVEGGICFKCRGAKFSKRIRIIL